MFYKLDPVTHETSKVGDRPGDVTDELWARVAEDWLGPPSKNRRGEDQKGTIHVSTVFLGIDHGFGEAAPVLFETMVFGGELDLFQDRYATWNEAVAGHRLAVANAKAAERCGTCGEKGADWIPRPGGNREPEWLCPSCAAAGA
jgi:hypothetical protein